MGMKKTEIGMIPEEWDVQSFSDTFRVLSLIMIVVNSKIYIMAMSLSYFRRCWIVPERMFRT